MYTCIYKFALQMKYIMLKRVKILILQITLVKLGSHKKKTTQFSYRLLEKTFINK